jgi:hypothetical protein
MATTRTLAERCNLTPERLRIVASYLVERAKLDEKWTPGTWTLIVWVLGSIIYWVVAGLSLKYAYEISDSDNDETKERITKEKNQRICMVLIIYFSLCIGLIIFYGWRVKTFQSQGWDHLHPGESYGGTNPILTWGLMSLFAVGGLFISIILIFYYSDHALPVGIIVLLCLLAIVISFTVALVGKAYVNCNKADLAFTESEKLCAVDYLKQVKDEQIRAAKEQIAQAASAKANLSSLQKADTVELAKLASSGGGAVQRASREVEDAAKAAATSRQQQSGDTVSALLQAAAAAASRK